jgi:hypothetical protein
VLFISVSAWTGSQDSFWGLWRLALRLVFDRATSPKLEIVVDPGPRALGSWLRGASANESSSPDGSLRCAPIDSTQSVHSD